MPTSPLKRPSFCGLPPPAGPRRGPPPGPDRLPDVPRRPRREEPRPDQEPPAAPPPQHRSSGSATSTARAGADARGGTDGSERGRRPGQRRAGLYHPAGGPCHRRSRGARAAAGLERVARRGDHRGIGGAVRGRVRPVDTRLRPRLETTEGRVSPIREEAAEAGTPRSSCAESDEGSEC
jgi:hypothetical protein